MLFHADSEEADAQADMSLCWAHISFCWFCHEVAHINSSEDFLFNYL